MEKYRITIGDMSFEVGVEKIVTYDPGNGDDNGNGGTQPEFPGGEWRVVKETFNAQYAASEDDAGKPVLEPYGNPENRIQIPAGDHVFVSPNNTVTGRGHARNLYAWSEGGRNFWDEKLALWVLTDKLGKPQAP